MSQENKQHEEKRSRPRPKPGVNLHIVRRLSVEIDHSAHTVAQSLCSAEFNGIDENGIGQSSLPKHDTENVGDTERLYKMETNGEKGGTTICCIRLNRKFRMMIYAFTYFLSGVTYSILAPFYPQVALKKGMSISLTGFVFSVYELMIFLTSPFFGAYLTTIGPKFLFISGIATAGACSLLFGTLGMCPPGTPFFVLSLLIRCVGAIGFSAFLTALMAAGTAEYPNNAATAMSILEGAFGIGMMIGPAIGGVLYTSGGFGTPFYSIGSLVLIEGFFAYLIMPAPRIDHLNEKSGSLLSLLRSPVVIIASLSTICACAGIGFLQPTLTNHLEPFGLSILVISIFFVIAPCLYTITAPILGYLSDNKGIYKELIVVGQFIYGIGFLFAGPSDVLPFLPNELWTVTLGLCILGFTFGCAIVPNFKCFLVGAIDLGFDENLETYGLVAGLVTSSYSFGAFFGPMVGGVLVQELGDRTAYTAIGIMNIGISVAAFVLFAIRRLHGRRNRQRLPSLHEREEAVNCDESAVLIKR